MTTQNLGPATAIRREPAALSASARPGWAVLAAALGFVAFYFATDFVTPNLASSALPLPDDPVRRCVTGTPTTSSPPP